MNDLLSDGQFSGHLQYDQDLSQFSPADYDPYEPLPTYTRTWGQFLRRPSKLPDNYDTRIDPNHIFVFAVHPITGIKRDFYVTPKPCEYCAKIRQVCSRSRPLCQRCIISGDPQRVCHVEDGWVKLPGPKCEKPKLQKKPSVALGPKTADPSSPSSPNDVPMLQRARTIAPHPLDESFSPPSSTPTPSTPNYYEPMAIPKKPPPKRVVPITRSENGNTTPLPQGVPAKEPAVNGRKKAHVPKIDRRKGKRVGRKSAADGNGKQLADGKSVGHDGTVWYIIQPGPSASPQSTTKQSSDNISRPPFTVEDKPRIWAKNKAELLEILPEMSDAFGHSGSGIYLEEAGLEPPIVFLEGSAWSQDHLDIDGSATISFVRDFTVPTNRTRLDTGKAVDFGHDQDMMLVDEIAPTRSSTSPSHSSTSHTQPVTEVPMPYGVCHPSRSLNGGRSQIPLNPVVSSYRTPNGHIPESNNSSLRITYPPLETPHTRLFTADAQTPLSAPSSRASYISGGPLPLASTMSAQSSCAASTYRYSLSGVFSGDGATMHQSDWPSTASQQSRSTATSLPIIGSPSQLRFSPNVLRVQHEYLQFKEMAGNVNLKLCPAEFTPIDLANSDLALTRDNDSNTGRTPNSPPKHRAAPHANQDYKQMTPEQFIRTMDEVNRNLINAIPAMAPERASLARQQAELEHKSNFIPSELPPDIRHLLDCHTYRIPVVLVVSRDYTPLPFNLPEGCGVCVLGFYKITDIQRTQMVQSEDDAWYTSRATWRLKLRWTPGGEDMPEEQQPLHPWWRAPPPIEQNEEPSPYSLLPMHLRSDFARPNSNDTVASEVYKRKGWHCTHCGRLNVQRLLGFQRCSCNTGNSMLPVDVLYVRDPHKMTPDSTPADTYPEGVSQYVLEGERGGTRTFVYSIFAKVEIKHVFTCNRPAVQEQANRLFREMQTHVPMAWQEAKTRLATGPYYTYLAGVGHEPDAPATPWSEVPACVKEGRELMEMYGTKKAAEEEFKVDQLTILGWTSPGTRKSLPLPAKGKPIAMLCLGADVELHVAPVSGFAVSPPRSVMKRSESVSVLQSQQTASKAVGDDPFDSPLSSASSDEEALSVRHGGGLVAGVAARTIKTKKPGETMLITLVHGDMVLFRGDDFEYTLHRTGMSIVLIGMSHGSKGS